MDKNSETGSSEDEFYKQVKQQRAAKLAVKANIHSRWGFCTYCVGHCPRFLCMNAFLSGLPRRCICVWVLRGGTFFVIVVVGSIHLALLHNRNYSLLVIHILNIYVLLLQ